MNDPVPTMRVISKRNPAGGVILINKADYNPDRHMIYDPDHMNRAEHEKHVRETLASAGYEDAVIEQIFEECFEKYLFQPDSLGDLLMYYENGRNPENQGKTRSNPVDFDDPIVKEALEYVKSKGYSQAVAEHIVQDYGYEHILEGKDFKENLTSAPVPTAKFKVGTSSARR